MLAILVAAIGVVAAVVCAIVSTIHGQLTEIAEMRRRHG
jgi:hypothetical protein